MRALPEVIGLFQQVVKEVKDKGLSQKEGLKKLKKQYESNLIDIKNELRDHFEIFAFHKYLSLDVDDYITACEKLESSQSELERNNYETLIQQIINGVKADCEKHGTKKGADATAIITVRKEVDKIRAFCRENRKILDLYEKHRDEIENTQEGDESKSPQGVSVSGGKNALLEELRNAGQLYYEKGKYIPYKSIPGFIQWCSENGYIDDGDKKDKYKDILTPDFIYHRIKNDCDLETINRYFRAVKKTRINKKPKSG